MEDFSTLFYLVESEYFDKWLEEIGDIHLFENREIEHRKQLEQVLGEEKKEILDKYKFCVEQRTSERDLKLGAKLFNLGMKMGYETGRIFAEMDYKDD